MPAADVWPRQRRPLGAALRSHSRVARESLAFVSSRFATSLFVWLLIGVALALPAALFLAVQSLEAAAGAWQGRPGFSVYFEPGVDTDDVHGLARRLQAAWEIDSAQVVTPQAALEEFRALADIDDALTMLEDNPLPATVRVVAAENVDPERLALLAAQAQGSAGVDEVDIETTWLQRLAAMRDLAERSLWVIAALLAPVPVLISAVAVRLAIETRLAELEVLALIGAGKGYLRRPFLYLGSLYGSGGALLATVLLAVALQQLEAPMARLASSYDADLELHGFDPMFVLVVLACGTVLGNFGALLASRRRLGKLTST